VDVLLKLSLALLEGAAGLGQFSGDGLVDLLVDELEVLEELLLADVDLLLLDLFLTERGQLHQLLDEGFEVVGGGGGCEPLEKGVRDRGDQGCFGFDFGEFGFR
jgi:hypothetical protein